MKAVNKCLAAFLLAGWLCAACSATRVVVDELGRKVTVADRPHRVVCLAPNVADDVYALGAGDDVAGVSSYTKYPPQAAAKTRIGVPLTPSIETIVSLHPDLVIASAETNREETVRELDRLNIAVFVINPRGLEGIFKSLQSLGTALNREEDASKLVSQLRSRLQTVRARAAGKPVVQIFMPIWYDPVITIGNKAFITDMIAAAGGKSVTDDITREWPQVNLEAIIERAPEALLLVRGSQLTLDDLIHRPGWDALPAIHNHRVYFADDSIELPGPIAFDALEDLAKQLHP